MHEVLVNRLGGLSLPRKSVIRLTDRPDMTLDVYRGRKTTMQQQQPRSSVIKETHRINHRSPMQTEKSHPQGKQIMPETRFTELPALSVDLRVGISRSTSETNV